MSAVSDRRLLKWLDRDPGRLERYLAENPEATDRLDKLTAFDDAVRSNLRGLFAVPEGLWDRVSGQPGPYEPGRELTTVVMDLFSLPWHLAWAFVDDPPSADNGARKSDPRP